jgi:hypothetical protein
MIDYISAGDDVSFKREIDALHCFGLNYKAYRRAMAWHPYEKDKSIWFPKFYKNPKWDNKISADGKFIYEKRKVDNEGFIKGCLLEDRAAMLRRIVFAREADESGKLMYVLKGVFDVDKRATKECGEVVHKKIADKVKTY